MELGLRQTENIGGHVLGGVGRGDGQGHSITVYIESILLNIHTISHNILLADLLNNLVNHK